MGIVFDQSLNTTDSPTFAAVNCDKLVTLTTTVTTTSYSQQSSDSILLVDDDTAGSTVTINLLLGSTAYDGSTLKIKKLGTTANVIIDGSGAQTIDGAATFTLTTQYESVTIVCDGTNWFIICGFNANTLIET